MTFGCSFTKYHWPTWADIVLKQADLEGFETDNWGHSGGGNLFIAVQVQHAIASGLLKAGDHAFISWTSFAREDRIVNNSWLMVGNIFNQSAYSQDWVEKFADVEFYTIRDCALINATRLALERVGVKQTILSMTQTEPFFRNDNPWTKEANLKIEKLLDIFKPHYDCKPILEVLGYPPPVTVQVAMSKDNPKDVYTDTHHLPGSMLAYVKQEICKLQIPWLTAIKPEVESWAIEWDSKIKTAPKPLQISDYPFTPPKNQQWGIL